MTDSPQMQLTPQQQQEHWYRETRRKAESAFRRTPVLVYTMGKVGSSTVYLSVREAGFASNAFHLHSLWPPHVAKWRDQLESDDVEVPLNLHESEAIIEQLQSSPDRPVKIITLIRDPLAREVSALFENRHRARHVLKKNDSFDVDKAVNHLVAEVSRPDPCAEFLSWFPHQPARVFGIDVMAVPFDKERGWQIYRQGPVEMLLMRLEDLSRIGSEAMTEFLGTSQPVQMVKAHERKEDSYALVKKAFKAPRSVCEELYAAPLMRHLYTDAQLSEMIDRWSSADETPEQCEQRVRTALLSDIETRHRWTLRETATLKADRATGQATIKSLTTENEQLRQEVARLRERLDSVAILGARNDQLQVEVADLRQRVKELAPPTESRPDVLPLTTGARKLRSLAGKVKRRVAGLRRAS